MTAQLSPLGVQKFYDNNGNPLAFGLLYTYAAGTTNPQATYVDSTQTTQNTNPIQLNFRGECSLWLDPSLSYKFLLTDQAGNTIPNWPVDNVPGGFGSLPLSVSLIPNPTNTWTLGNSTHSWANVYVGTNNATVLDTVSGNIGYYARTAAEITAGVTPTNYSYPPLHAWRYMSANQVADVVARTLSIDCSTALNALLSVARAGNGQQACYVPSGSYLVSTTLNLANLQATQVTLYGDSHGTGLYNTAPISGTAFYGRTSTKAVIETQGSHYVTLRDFQIYTISSDANRSVVGIFQSRTTVQDSDQYHNYERVIVNLASNTSANASHGCIAVYNLGSEHGIYDHLVLNTDTPIFMCAANPLGYSPVYGTLGAIPSCALHHFRQCAFIAATAGIPAVLLAGGIQSATFQDCYYGNLTTGTGAAISVGSQAANPVCDLFFIGGQCENWNQFIEVGVSIDNLKIDTTFGLAGATGPLVAIDVANNIDLFGPSIHLSNPLLTSLQLVGTGAVTGSAIYGGDLVIAPGQGLSASNLTLAGTVIRDSNTSPAPITVQSPSMYQLNNATNTVGGKGVFVGTLTGCTTSPTTNCSYGINGNSVTVHLTAVSATSNTTAMTITGLPTACQPSVGQSGYANIVDSGANAAGEWSVSGSGTITFFKGLTQNPNTFTNAGTKGINSITMTYVLS